MYPVKNFVKINQRNGYNRCFGHCGAFKTPWLVFHPPDLQIPVQGLISIFHIHHNGTWFLITENDRKRIVFSLVVWIHHITAFLGQIVFSIADSRNFSGIAHDAHRFLIQFITPLLRKDFRMIRFKTHSADHIRGTEQVPDNYIEKS